jgi:hypothetical protein
VNADDVDWSVQDGNPESTIICRCSRQYRSHVKVTLDGDELRTFTRKPCPNCGRNDTVISALGDREAMDL